MATEAPQWFVESDSDGLSPVETQLAAAVAELAEHFFRLLNRLAAEGTTEEQNKVIAEQVVQLMNRHLPQANFRAVREPAAGG